MAGPRYALVTLKNMSNVLIPQKQLSPYQARHQAYSVLSNPREVYKKSYSTRDLLWSTQHVNMCLVKNRNSDNNYKWRNTILLITGASKGTGSYIMRMALEEGAKRVTNVDSDEKAGLGLKSELNHKFGAEKVQFIKCDLSDEEEIKKSFRSVLKDKSETYVVVNNAGVRNESLEEYKKQIDINVSALVTGSLTALDLMRVDRKGQGGAIINISSVAALCPLPINPIYNATKSAVLTFSLGLGNEEFYSKTGVRVMTICLGDTASGFNEIKNVRIFDKEMENRYAMTLPGQTAESAARAVIDMYKQGGSGTTWLSNANKPVEDITYIVRQAYSLLTQPIFT